MTMCHRQARHASCQPRPILEFAKVTPIARAYLTIPTRPPAEKWVRSPDEPVVMRAYQAFYPATNYLVCPTMKLTTLEDVLRSLERMEHAVRLEEPVRVKARLALDAMLAVT